MPRSFTYTALDIGNSQIVPDQPGLPTYTIVTQRSSFDSPKETAITSSVNNAIVGFINWKQKTMGVNGIQKPYGELKTHLGGTFSLEREWKWSGKKYIINFKKGVWTAKLGEEPVAIYTNSKVRSFGKFDPATFNFPSDAITEEEMIFLILALLFQDIKLPPKQGTMTLKEGATEVGIKTAGTIAGNAVGACCTIQ